MGRWTGPYLSAGRSCLAVHRTRPRCFPVAPRFGGGSSALTGAAHLGRAPCRWQQLESHRPFNWAVVNERNSQASSPEEPDARRALFLFPAGATTRFPTHRPCAKQRTLPCDVAPSRNRHRNRRPESNSFAPSDELAMAWNGSTAGHGVMSAALPALAGRVAAVLRTEMRRSMIAPVRPGCSPAHLP